jgi:hypothetical protein
MNSGRGLTGVLDPGLTAPIPDNVTGPRCRARRGGRPAGSLASAGPHAEMAGWLGSSLGQIGTSGGPESRQLGRAQKNNRWMGWDDSRTSWVLAHLE